MQSWCGGRGAGRCAVKLALAADKVLRSPNGQVVLRVARTARASACSGGARQFTGAVAAGAGPGGQAPLGQWCWSSGAMRCRTGASRWSRPRPRVRGTTRGATLSFHEQGGERRLLLDLRAYDDGVALRYHGRITAVQLAGERTGFVPAGDQATWSPEGQTAARGFVRARALLAAAPRQTV